MISSLLANSIGISEPHFQDNIAKHTNIQTKQDEHKRGYSKYAIGGLSLITLGTTAGMIYFARQNIKLNKKIIESAKSIQESTLPKIINTAKSPEVIETTTKPTKQSLVQGILRQISKDLNEYLKKCQDNKVNPEKIDEILTKAVGEENVYERPFKSTPLHPRGRVKQYTSPNGRVYVLETHEVLGKNVTRLYMHDKDKNLRAYLFPDGTFRLNSFKSEESHFITTAKGKRWMEKSRFLNNGAK